MRTGLNAKASGDTGRVMVVLLTDGRANVSLAKSNEDPEALAEGAPKLSKVGPLMTPCFGQDCLQISPVVWYVPGQAMQCNHEGACETPVTKLITVQHCCPKERCCLQVWSTSGLLRSRVWQFLDNVCLVHAKPSWQIGLSNTLLMLSESMQQHQC